MAIGLSSPKDMIKKQLNSKLKTIIAPPSSSETTKGKKKEPISKNK